MTIHRRHDLPPQPDLEVPLLSFIAQHGGSIRVSDNREKIKDHLASVFCVSEELLAEEIRTGTTVENRWWNYIRQCCRMLRHKRHLKGVVGTGEGSGRNYWSLSESGCHRLLNSLKDLEIMGAGSAEILDLVQKTNKYLKTPN